MYTPHVACLKTKWVEAGKVLDVDSVFYCCSSLPHPPSVLEEPAVRYLSWRSWGACSYLYAGATASKAGSSLKPNDICYIILAIYWYLYVLVEHNDVSYSDTSGRNDHYGTVQQNFYCALYNKRRRWRNCVCWGAISCKSVTMKYVTGVVLCLQRKNLICSGNLFLQENLNTFDFWMAYLLLVSHKWLLY